jgi:hypothetical protein
MSRIFRDIAVYLFGLLFVFIFKTILGLEVEEFWDGTVQPYLDGHAWSWVATMLSFLPTFWGGVALTLAALIAIDRAWYLLPVYLHKTRPINAAPTLAQPPSEKTSNASVAANMRAALGQMRTLKKRLDSDDPFDLDDLRGFARKFRATEVTLQKIGYQVPWLDVDADPVGYIERSIEYLSKVEPLIAASHEREAKKQARLTVETFHPDFVDPQRL